MRCVTIHLVLALLLCGALAAEERQSSVGSQEGAASVPTAKKSSPVLEGIRQALEYVEKAGNFGFALLLCFFFVVVCLSLPTTPIELSAGFMYGPVWGCVAGITGKTVGSFMAYFIARVLGERFGWKVPAALESKLGALKSAPLVTMIGIRVAPLPLGLKNYGLALAGVDAVPYVLASLVVNTPFSILWGSLGASCSSLGDALNFDTSKVSFLGALPDWAKPLVATGVVVSVGMVAMKAMSSKTDESKTNGHAKKN